MSRVGDHELRKCAHCGSYQHGLYNMCPKCGYIFGSGLVPTQ